MMGPTHRVWGAFCGAAVATLDGRSWSMVAMTAIVATATSNGPASPDMDQSKPWVAVRKRLPGAFDQVLNHRALSHWWGLPVIAFLFVAQLPHDARWAATALLIGWTSHLAGDLVFGRIPLFPWGSGPCVGLGMDTGGLFETPARLLIIAALAVVLVWPAALTNPVHHVITTAERTLHP